MNDLGLGPGEIERYARHLVMDGVGPEGQRRLLEGSVCCVGAGGLGAPAIQYLAAAGVGTLGVVDDDVVERSNLQRQVVHADADVGRKKVESAREYVADLNPDVEVRTHDARLAPGNAEALLADYDCVIDGSDNVPTHYLVNDACVLADVPFVHGAVVGFEGQVTTVVGGRPCYRCLFPEAPPADAVPDCASTGVLGVLPGTIGCLQATEALKHLIGVGDDRALVGRLLHYDALSMDVERVTVRPNPECPVCGDDPRIESVGDATYDGEASAGGG